MSHQDIKMVQDNQGYFDIEINEDTKDFSSVDGMETAYLYQLFCDRRATKADIGSPRQRQVWIGDILTKPDYESGSLLHLKTGSRATPSDYLEAANYAKEAMKYFVNIRSAKEVTAEVIGNNISGVIKLENDNTIRYNNLWRSTGAID